LAVADDAVSFTAIPSHHRKGLPRRRAENGNRPGDALPTVDLRGDIIKGTSNARLRAPLPVGRFDNDF
jgi:hypothetical protein